MSRRSRRAEVVMLSLEGLTTAEIARRTGLTRGTVSVYRSRAGLDLPRERGPEEPEPTTRTVRVPFDVLAMLQPFAAARDIHVCHLARDLIATIADDGIADAVLDDGVTTPKTTGAPPC
ncbi:sigma-70 region 4 domain-containing protein [Aurantimonas sp. 22II-16-19i]|uniref:sigma-70 region 4 domain-containing protein n=1 Tax=Aurantimonas sp. 22II-16-19i TaxID=1317114 RepID=UPI0009F7B03A|nr:sigma-70 region 4 domain-containing protein [Aurantimonas sp. 22II-16-19i]ORE90977.1 hypothetical protein ATO4_19984 [Aurantimonas sp. 22II-16-19i]